MEPELPDCFFDFTKRKPVKCLHCGRERGQHRAQTFQCPALWSKGRTGYTHYQETVFEPKPRRSRKGVE